MSSGASSLEKAFHNEASQLSLLGADSDAAQLDAMRGEDGKLPADAFRRLRHAERGGQRGPGRPLGALAKRSEQLAKLVMSECGDPVLGMGKLYAMPLDQLCELILIADGTAERSADLEEMTAALGEQVAALCKSLRNKPIVTEGSEFRKAADRLADAAEKLEAVAKRVQGKPGQIALAALNIQLAARKSVAEYVHSKLPTKVDLTVRRDGVLVMPGLTADDTLRDVQSQLNTAMKNEVIDAETVARLEFKDGRVVDPEGEIEDAEFYPVDEDSEADA